MSNLTELELQNLRHLITGYETSHDKMTSYAEQVSDQQLKQYFSQAAQSAMDNKKTLTSFLGK